MADATLREQLLELLRAELTLEVTTTSEWYGDTKTTYLQVEVLLGEDSVACDTVSL